MPDRGARNVVILVASLGAVLLCFYGFLAYRAKRWSPLWAISPGRSAYTPIPRRTVLSEEDSLLERGRLLYQQLGCGVCHGPQGEGGVKNPNAPGGAIPGLYDLAQAYTPKDLKDKIKKGAQPVKLEENQPEPPLVMPAWENALTEEEMEDLAHYLFSLKSGEKTAN